MKRSAYALAVAAMFLSGPQILAHHSFAMFDRTRDVELEGIVKEFQWTAPHAWIQMVVSDGAGGQKEWSIECGAPGMMARTGWTSTLLKPGDKVKLVIHPLRSGGPSGSLVRATLADGRVMGPGGVPPPPKKPAASSPQG